MKLKAGNLIVGDTQANNTLEMIIPKPNKTMAEGTTGQLEVIMPPWYKIGKVEIPSFKNTMCASPCMNFAWAWAHSNTIYLKYKDLSDKCRKDDEVKITCRGFRSPISPGSRLVYVKISTFDNEKDQKPIAILSGNLKDASFLHVLIANDDFKVKGVETKTDTQQLTGKVLTPAVLADVAAGVLAAPAVMEMETVTKDTYKIMLSLKVPIPMEKGCFINVYMPQQLQVLNRPT